MGLFQHIFNYAMSLPKSVIGKQIDENTSHNNNGILFMIVIQTMNIFALSIVVPTV